MLNLKAHHSPDAQPHPGATPEQVPGHLLAPGEMQLKHLPQNVQAAINDYQAAMKVNHALCEQGMTNGVSKYQQTKDGNSFREDMYKLRAQDQERSNREFDKLCDRLIKIGEQDPGSQREILDVFTVVQDFTETRKKSFSNFINELNHNIERWGNEALPKVRNWVSGDADAIAKFFSGLA